MRSTHNSKKKSSSWFWLSKSADLSKPWGRFFQILCVSQKVRPLITLVADAFDQERECFSSRKSTFCLFGYDRSWKFWLIQPNSILQCSFFFFRLHATCTQWLVLKLGSSMFTLTQLEWIHLSTQTFIQAKVILCKPHNEMFFLYIIWLIWGGWAKETH